MRTVGVRELKNRLTHYLGVVKEGEQVVVTDRGRPVAILHSLDRIEENAGLDELLAALAAQGALNLPTAHGPRAPFKPRPVQGEAVSATLLRERR